MILENIALQNFRSYTKSNFSFSPGTTVIVGPNTSGKTNFIEAIYLLATGKSFRAEKDVELIRFGEELGRVKGKIDDTELEVVLTTQLKKYLVNGVAKRRVDFVGNLTAVLFSPADLEIIIDSPGIRRNFLDQAIIQVDREYRQAHLIYTKAIRQRNALLQKAKETGIRNQKMFDYWDNLVILHGQIITNKREEFIAFINKSKKYVFELFITYDKSVISKERLLQYKDAEVGAGVTLVGPHRDDFLVFMDADKEVKSFGSRGQQRLAVLQLKLLEMQHIEETTGKKPLLLLDDIFSELDNGHIQMVSQMIGKNQTILTTTHKEFVGNKFLKEASMIELEL